MASYAPYLLMQAFGALIFAYMGGTLVFKDRRLYMALVSLGLYLILFAALLELWGDRAGWTPSRLGLSVALVSTAVASIGAGCLLREAVTMEEGPRLTMIAYGLVIAAVLMGAVLALGAESSDSIVKSGEAIGTGLAGGYSKLGAAGWALGSPLFLGAILIVLSGLRASWKRDDARGLWLLSAGILFLLWPFDIQLGELPLSPTLMFLAIAMTYLGFQETKDAEEEEAKGESEEVGTKEKGTAPEQDDDEVEEEEGADASPDEEKEPEDAKEAKEATADEDEGDEKDLPDTSEEDGPGKGAENEVPEREQG